MLILLLRNQVSVGVSPKAGKSKVPHPKDEERGLWVDTPLVVRLFKQPSQTLFNPPMPSPAERLLHFADLALGSIKPDRFKPEKVSKKRKNK